MSVKLFYYFYFEDRPPLHFVACTDKFVVQRIKHRTSHVRIFIHGIVAVRIPDTAFSYPVVK